MDNDIIIQYAKEIEILLDERGCKDCEAFNNYVSLVGNPCRSEFPCLKIRKILERMCKEVILLELTNQAQENGLYD
jgi:hypothetical protein